MQIRVAKRTGIPNKEWVDYIGKLQDRERQKIASSGLNNWVAYTAIGALCYFLLKDFEVYKTSYNILFLCFTFFLNAVLSVFDIFNSAFRVKKIISYRFPRIQLDKVVNKPLRWYEILMLIISLIPNIIFLGVYFPFTDTHSDTRYYILLIYFLLYIFKYTKLLYVAIAAYLGKLLPPDFKDEESYSLSYPPIIYLAITVIALYVNLNHITFFNFDKKVNLIFDGFSLVLIILIGQMLFSNFSKKMKISWLESFEKDILLGKLNDHEIKRKLEKVYYNLSNIDDYF